jgi:hypothetical protein
MDFTDFLQEQYLRQCSWRCNHGGYTRLESEKEEIRQRLVDKYGVNGNRKEVLKQVLICEETVFSFLEELSKDKFRHYMWITDFHKGELTSRLSTALQEG